MKITFASIVLNEAEYLARNLEQHLPFCDEWIIVEGADRRYPPSRVTEDGLSTDGTAEIIRGFSDPDRKIRFIQHGWAAEKCALRNRYAELIEDERIVIIFDADEFLIHEHLFELLHHVAALPRPGCVRIPHAHFWKHDRQVVTGGYYDVPHDRAYKWAPGARYTDNHNHPCLPGLPTSVLLRDLCNTAFARDWWRETEGEGFVARTPTWLHYGFCKKPENIADKNAYYIGRGEASTRPGTTKDRAAWFDEQKMDGLTVSPWAGPWPEVMQP